MNICAASPDNPEFRQDLMEKKNFEMKALRKTHVSAFNVDGDNMRTFSLSSFVDYFSRRDSSIPVLAFKSGRLSSVVESSRRNDADGRPF